MLKNMILFAKPMIKFEDEPMFLFVMVRNSLKVAPVKLRFYVRVFIVKYEETERSCSI